MLKLSGFFGKAAQKVKVGVTLISVSVVDKLHWSVLGARGRRRKANLSDMVDPDQSVVIDTTRRLYELMDGWSPTGE